MSDKNEAELVLLGQAGWSKAAITAQFERLCNSPAFDDGDQARTLLGYLIQEALAGRVPHAADVAHNSLGKRNYDSRDPIVRTAMGRLRERMQEHYAKRHKGQIRLVIPEGSYIVFAPRNTAATERADSSPNASILEPGDKAEVHQVATVRGRIDTLDPDLRVWLVVLASDGFYYPQCRVSRRSPSWQYDVRIGRMQWGATDGEEFGILLVAADIDGDLEFGSYMKRCGDGFGTRLPTDVTVLDSKSVIRRDIRPEPVRS